MISWIRVDRAIGDDVKVYQLAEATKLDVDATIGKLVRIFAEMALHAKDGDLSTVPDQALEDWANWRGKRGVFAGAFRQLFAPEGAVTDWAKHNGTAIEKAERDAARLAESRKNRAAKATQSRDSRATEARASRVDVDVVTKISAGRDLHTGRDLHAKNSLSRSNGGAPAGAGGACAVEPPEDVYPADFESCWQQYPKRPNHNKREAFRKWQARRRAGVEAAVLLDGVSRYRRHCDSEGKTGTQFVMHAAKFFGRDEHYLLPWDPPVVAHRPSGAATTAAAGDPAAMRLLDAFTRAGLTHSNGNHGEYRRGVDELAAMLGYEVAEFRTLVGQLKPWDLDRITFEPDRRREFAGRYARVQMQVAA